MLPGNEIFHENSTCRYLSNKIFVGLYSHLTIFLKDIDLRMSNLTKSDNTSIFFSGTFWITKYNIKFDNLLSKQA